MVFQTCIYHALISLTPYYLLFSITMLPYYSIAYSELLRCMHLHVNIIYTHGWVHLLDNSLIKGFLVCFLFL
jgi:hypothetical protein